MDLLTAVRRLRRDHLDDLGGDKVMADQWITDDTACRWKNTQLAEFLDAAQGVYLETVGLYDSNTTAGAQVIPLVAGQSIYAIAPHIISIERARLLSQPERGPVLERLPHRRVEERARTELTVRYYQDDLYHREIRLWGTPKEENLPDSLVLQVKRHGLNTLYWNGAASNLQTFTLVQPQDHHKLLPYAAYLAYSVEDAESDVEWPDKARHWLQIHIAQVGPLDPAWLHNWRRRQTANKLHRAKPYGLT